ncbi:MAG: pseudouridine synthase [Alphaproteobacteria bacterium]
MGKEKALPKSMRLDRLLSNLGYGGRKEMAMAVKNEWIDIDGERVTNPSLNVDLDWVRQGRVTLDGKALDPLTPFTIMLNKPAGYTCSHKDPAEIVYDLLPEQFARRKIPLSMVGRLDKYSTGQLLLTDDGDLLHRITHPKSHASKHYRVTLRDDLKGDEGDLFASGEFTLPCEEKPLKPAQWTSEGAREGVMILHEGRNRQIRRMFDKLGNEVVTLHRFQTGNLLLGDLEKGKWRALSNDELVQIVG